MGLSIEAVQNLLELYQLGHLKNYKSVVEFGSQELHLKKNDLTECLTMAGFDTSNIDSFENIENWPDKNKPRCSSKPLYKLLGIDEYYSFDINNQLNSINHDYNNQFTDKKFYSKFDIVTDYCACGHAFNIGEAYRTIHNLCKKDGIIIGVLPLWKGNGYYLYDHYFFEGLAAANNYNIIFSSYVVSTGEKTKAGTKLKYHVPLSRSLLDTFDIAKLDWLGVCFVLKKQSNNEFKFPYQGEYDSKKYNHLGFNRYFYKDPPGYSYIPMFDLKTISGRVILKELLKRIKNKIKF